MTQYIQYLSGYDTLGFIDIEVMENYDFNSYALFSAKWKDGPLYYDFNKKIYKRKPNIKVVLRMLESPLNVTEFLSEV